VKRGPQEIPDADHEVVIERVCAIDVAKASGMVCVRVPDETRPGRRVSRVWEVAATTRAVTALADQLVADGVARVTVESTSDYWRIWFYLLEAAGLDVQLVNARDVKNLPGRPKTDKLDAVWLAKLTEKGLVRPSFVPPAPIRQLRDYTRLRVDLTRERTRHWQRLEKLLEDALIKVSAVASTIDSVSVREMVEALIAGQDDPRKLAELARGRMKSKRLALIEALTGRFDAHHGELARILLDQIDSLSAQIERLTTRAEQLLATMPQAQAPKRPDHHTDGRPPGTDSSPPSPSGTATTAEATQDTSTTQNTEVPRGLSAWERLDEITGIGPLSAQVIIAEVGLDMSRFATADHLVSWAKLSPRTAGVRGHPAGRGHRQGQPLPQGCARRSGRGGGQNGHLPRGTLPACRETTRQAQSPRRPRPLHPGRCLAPAVRPHRSVPRPRLRLPHHPHRPRPQSPQPHPPTHRPRLQRHPRTHGGLKTRAHSSPVPGCPPTPRSAGGSVRSYPTYFPVKMNVHLTVWNGSVITVPSGAVSPASCWTKSATSERLAPNTASESR